MNKKNKIILLTLIYSCLCLLSFYRHKNIEPNTFRSEIWADRAGYYIYLPSLFIYKFSSDKFPDNIENQTGNGFSINKDENKIRTKYTYGVALLQLPFFLIADTISFISNDIPRDGFSFYYQNAINFAAIFYLVIGLYLLFLTLKIHFDYKVKTILITIILLLFGTNLYYYGIIETGMSHVYSFFLFSSILYLLSIRNKFKNQYIHVFLLAIISSMIVLIRPTNVLFISIIFIYNIEPIKQAIIKIKNLANLKIVFIWILSFLLVFIPQFIYWKYANDNYLSYSYGDETFSNILSPKFLEILFAPNNGLFPYSLIFILVLWGIVFILKSSKNKGLYYLTIFIVLCYLTASWHDWKFGCGAGMRNMVEYYSLFSFPLCFTLNKISSINSKLLRYTLWTFISLLAIISLKINYHYYGCYFNDTWDWTQYIDTLTYPLMIH